MAVPEGRNNAILQRLGGLQGQPQPAQEVPQEQEMDVDAEMKNFLIGQRKLNAKQELEKQLDDQLRGYQASVSELTEAQHQELIEAEIAGDFEKVGKIWADAVRQSIEVGKQDEEKKNETLHTEGGGGGAAVQGDALPQSLEDGKSKAFNRFRGKGV